MRRFSQFPLLAGSILCVAAVLAPPVASAQQVVVNGGSPNQGIGQYIYDLNEAATKFSLSGPTQFDGIRFWGILDDFAPNPPNIFWQILEDATIDPFHVPGTAVIASGSAVATSTFDSDLGIPGYGSWQFDLAVGPQTLTSGVFWLALHAPADPKYPDADPYASLMWETSDVQGANASQQLDAGTGWGPSGDAELAFALTNSASVVTTPEPATFTLLATGLFGVAGIGLRRRRRTPQTDV